MMTICSLLPAAALCGVTRVSSRSGAVSLLVLTQFCFGANASGPVSNRLDVAPRLSGVVTGISNSFGSLPGILAPLMIGLVLDSGHCPAPGSHAPAKPSCTSAWDVVWFSAAGFFVLGWISFMAMGRADPHIHPTEVVILRDELCINDEDGEDEDSFLLPKD
mmetsp:Transcript_42973/g.93363  ORF Transcript_42973/g.93363 Transcript_42973/m.93363 type:complete len:162 (-) Transcript_42973:55-540(-)